MYSIIFQLSYIRRELLSIFSCYVELDATRSDHFGFKMAYCRFGILVMCSNCFKSSFRNSKNVLGFEIKMRLPDVYREKEDEVDDLLVEGNMLSDNYTTEIYPTSVPSYPFWEMSRLRGHVPDLLWDSRWTCCRFGRFVM